MAVICENCKAEIQGAPKFCPKCGAKVQTASQSAPGTKICPQCGAENAVSAKFCKSDGYRFLEGAEAVSTGRAVETTAPAPSPQPVSPTAPIGGETSKPGLNPSSPRPAHPSGVVREAVADEGALICPECGTPNLRTAQFCKKDGAPLQGGSPAPEQPTVRSQPESPHVAPPAQPVSEPIAEAEPQGARTSRKPFAIVAVAVLAVATLSAGGLYWAGYIGDRQASVQDEINAELGGRGLGSVKITVTKDWKATAEGVVGSQAEKQQALALLKSHGDLKELSDNIRVKPTRAELEQRLGKALADAGLKGVAAQFDDGLTMVTLADAELGPEDRTKAEQLVASEMTAAAGIGSIKVVHAPPVQPAAVSPAEGSAPPAIDVAAVQQTVNKQLRGAGLGNISARVDQDGNAVLQGVAATKEEKDRAIRLALAQPGVAGVNDMMSVLPPVAAPPPPVAKKDVKPPPPPPVAARPDPAKLEGELNRALRNGGAGGVTAEVGADFSVTLKGSATSAAQKNRAFQIARQFQGVGNLKDRVFVVE